MKKFFVFGLCAVLAIFTSCSKDDLSGNIVGSWRMVKSVYTEMENGKVVDNNTMEYKDSDQIWVLGKDGVFEAYSSGSKFGSGRYSYSNGKLNVADELSGISSVYNVVKLTDTELVFLDSEVERVDGITYKEEYRIYFERVK